MTARRRPPKKPGPTEPENGAHATGVVLEDIRGQMKVVIEALRGTATSGELRDLATRTETRMDLFSDALRVTRAEVAARFDDVDKRFDDVDKRFDGVDKRFDDVDKRFDGVDKRFDGVDKRFDDVERELRAVRQDVARQAQGSEIKGLEQRITVVERHLGL
jgi:septation ring formation regulator EzrA